MDDDFFRREYDLGPQKRDHLFIWTIFIILLIGRGAGDVAGEFLRLRVIAENPAQLPVPDEAPQAGPAVKRFEYTRWRRRGDFFTPQKLYDK